MSRRFVVLGSLLSLVFPAFVHAQGLLVDVRPDQRFRLPRPIVRPNPPPAQSYKIKDLSVNVNLDDQVARVQVTQTFVNTGSRQMEVCFVFPLPYDGAVDRMTFMVDGKEFDARLLTAGEARRVYEGYIRRNQDPALIEWMGTGMFKTSVFPVPPGASRSVTLRYSQVCRKFEGLTELLFPLSTAKYTSQAVEKVTIDVTVRSQQPIKNVYSPTHSVDVQKPSDRSARVVFSSTNEIPSSDFRLLYDVGTETVGASILSYRPQSSDDGYFLMLMSPEIKAAENAPTKKTVVFVVDRSGSMSGKKIEQAKGALKFVLNNLNEGDLFNIIAYDSSVESFRPELEVYREETRAQALGFVEGIYAGGSTNIDGALNSALSQLQDSARPSYVLFLTDGLPTTGERNESQIVVNARQRNKVRARVFAFGVGYDVNSRLLDKLARGGFGQSEYVRPDEDIEAHVSRLYRRVGAPAMTDLAIKFDLEGVTSADGTPVNRMYPKDAYDLFAGDQLVLVGRYRKSGAAKVTVSGKVGGQSQTFDFPAKLVEQSHDETHAYVEKLWAVRRVGEIIDEIDLQGKNQELVNELVALATRHGILTPYTSFLADENASFRDVAAVRLRAGDALESLQQVDGRGGVAQRMAKSSLQRANRAASADSLQLGGGFGGGGQASPLPPGAPAGGRGGVASGKNLGTPTILTMGTKTFYRRNDRWIDSAVTEDKEKQAVKIERYSNEYFELITKLGKDLAKYLAIEGDVTVELNGKTYSY